MKDEKLATTTVRHMLSEERERGKQCKMSGGIKGKQVEGTGKCQELQEERRISCLGKEVVGCVGSMKTLETL